MHRRKPHLPVVAACVLAIGLVASGGILGNRRGQSRRGSRGPLRGPAGRDPGVPWDVKGPVREFDDVAFHDRSPVGGLSETEARQWLEQAKGQPLHLAKRPYGIVRTVEFKGLAKLRADWAPEAVLRLSSWVVLLKLHFCAGQEVTVLASPATWPWHRWAAYRTRRQPGEPIPKLEPGAPPVVTLLATDDNRSGLSYSDTVEVRCRDGFLILSRGDIRLLTVPFAGKPTAVYLEAPGMRCCSATWRCVAASRRRKTRSASARWFSAARRRARWRGTQSPGRRPLQPPAGRLRRAESPQGRAPVTAIVRIDSPGLYEVIVQVENPTFGSGVFLADEDGLPLGGIDFVRDARNGWMGFGPGKPVGLWGVVLEPETTVAPCAGRQQWLRLVLGGGLLRYWTSPDGQHWGQVSEPQGQAGLVRHVGLHLQPGTDPRQIRLRTLQVRTLDGIMALSSPALHEEAAKQGMAKRNDADVDSCAWQQRIAESCSAGADPAAWRSACAIPMIAGHANPTLTKPLLDELLRDGLARLPGLEARLALLEDAALIYDVGRPQATSRVWPPIGSDWGRRCCWRGQQPTSIDIAAGR